MINRHPSWGFSILKIPSGYQNLLMMFLINRAVVKTINQSGDNASPFKRPKPQ